MAKTEDGKYYILKVRGKDGVQLIASRIERDVEKQGCAILRASGNWAVNQALKGFARYFENRREKEEDFVDNKVSVRFVNTEGNQGQSISVLELRYDDSENIREDGK